MLREAVEEELADPKVLVTDTTAQEAVMRKLPPQIRYWIKTGFVAANKIISRAHSGAVLERVDPWVGEAKKRCSLDFPIPASQSFGQALVVQRSHKGAGT